MSSEIRAGVRLNLNDQFSPGLKTAGVSMDGFKARAVGVAEGVGKAFSGLGGTLASVGVGIGAAALIREGIGIQDAVTRIATSAGAFGDEADELEKRLHQVSFASRVPVQDLIDFATAAANGAVSIDDILENLPFMADVIQGVGVAGADAGQLLSLFLNRGADADTLREKLNDITEILARTGNIGIPELLRYLPSLLEESGTAGLDGINDIVAAVSALRMGTDGARQAIYQYRAAMRDFARPEVRQAIWRYTQFDVGDADAGELRGFAEIMGRLSELAERVGGTGDFREALHLSDATIRALRQYNNHFEDTVNRIGELGDTSEAVAMRAAQNADTIQGSLNQLRTAASEFASATLMGPVERLADLLSQHPEGMRNAVNGLAAAVAAFAGMKALTTVVSFIGSLKSLRGVKGLGGGVPPGGGLGPVPGGAGIPVFVTNMGVGGLGGKKKAAARSGKRKSAPLSRTTARASGSKKPRPPARAGIAPPPAAPPAAPPPPGVPANAGRTAAPPGAKGLAGGAGLGAAFAAMSAIPRATAELREISKDEALTDRERGAARGGAIGDATGSIAGAAVGGAIGVKAGAVAGAKLGAVIGSIVPGLGTLIGGAVGAGIGAGVGAVGMRVGGRAGRAAGAGIGGAAAGRGRPAATPFPADGDVPPLDAAAAGTAAPSGRMAAAPPGISQLSPVPVNDLIVTPGGTFSTHPDDYIMAMKRPTDLLGDGIRDEVRTVEHVIKEAPPVTVDGEIVLRSELVIDDREYRLRQSVGRNTTPYRFATGSAADARAIQ